jgi:two-component system CheB/CheR fusion protein
VAEFPIVGIGSSAGGLEALQTLFRRLPADSGLAFVVAAHLDPTQKSHLSELLGRCTKMPVVQIENSVEVEHDHVYVIAPDQELTIKQGVLRSSKPTAPRGHRHPVDSFFRSLAEDQGERAIAIILSGTGTNGSLGLRFIKAEGGIVLVQEPESAGFEGMPRSAIATGVVDLVLPPDKMPQALLNLARHPYVRQPAAAVEEAEPEERLRLLLTLVRAQTKRDFSSYRKRTLLRRIHRRMGLRQIESLSDYVERLQDDPTEIRALAADLTINVTGFFRDPEAWRVLAEKVFAPLVRERRTDSAIRVWIAGCSTGEEAYSLAMLVTEQAEAAGKSFDLKLFATDVTEGVLSSARAGQYPSSIAIDVGEKRLERFFEMQDDTYRIRKTLRDAIVFAPQNLLQDPPFSRLDLVSCRNLLIYLEPDFQKRVLALFHFALREGGHLFLGPAETISGQEELFQPVSKKWRIFRRLGPTRHDVVDFPLIGRAELDSAAQSDVSTADPEPRVGPGELMDQALLEHYTPASALIDARSDVHYLRGPTDLYLQPPSGEPSHNLLAMAREGLQMPLRAAVRKALDKGEDVTTAGYVRRSGSRHPVRLVVRPLKTGRHGPTRLLVSFFEREVAADEAPPSELKEAGSDGELQAELDTAREDLRLSIEQMEAANEELKASNEEIRSINEELQASNEELETSKEELQSLNEELNTVNAQLQAKVGELEARTDDLNNLLNSTDVATLFLDRSLCIRWFTASMKALLELRPTDIGRPISHFAQRFKGGDMLEDARKVLERLVPSSGEVVDDLGRWYIKRIMPYRTAADRIDGVVVTFTEITERKTEEQRREALLAQLAEERARLEAVLRHMPAGVILAEAPSGRPMFSNEQVAKIWRHPFYEGEAIADYQRYRGLHADGSPLRPEEWPLARSIASGEVVIDEEIAIMRGDDTPGVLSVSSAPVYDGNGTITAGVAMFVDVTGRKENERERELLAAELSHRVKNTLAVVQSLAMQTDGRIGTVAAYREAFVGRLQALARAHNALVDAHLRGTDLKTLVEEAVAAYRVDHPDVVEVEGEPVAITAKQGLGLSLILHELGTNAAKYGALTRSKGRLYVSWQIEAESRRSVRLRWQERHGPAVAAPGEKGFGTRLIERACAYELEGEVELDYAPSGLSCELVFPVR